MMNCTALSFEAKDIGKKYKKSKKRFIWRFYFDCDGEQDEHMVIALFSQFTGTQRIYHNIDLVRYQTGQFFSSFNHKFPLDDNNYAKVQYKDYGNNKKTLTLVINGVDFNELYCEQNEEKIPHLVMEKKEQNNVIYFNEYNCEEIADGIEDEEEEIDFQQYKYKIEQQQQLDLETEVLEE